MSDLSKINTKEVSQELKDEIPIEPEKTFCSCTGIRYAISIRDKNNNSLCPTCYKINLNTKTIPKKYYFNEDGTYKKWWKT